MSIFVTLGPQEAEKSTKTECHMFFGTPCTFHVDVDNIDVVMNKL